MDGAASGSNAVGTLSGAELKRLRSELILFLVVFELQSHERCKGQDIAR